MSGPLGQTCYQTGMKASLSGQIRQTRLPEWRPLLPLFEAIMNAYQAIQERGTPDGEIIINVLRAEELELGTPAEITGFRVTDNGRCAQKDYFRTISEGPVGQR